MHRTRACHQLTYAGNLICFRFVTTGFGHAAVLGVAPAVINARIAPVRHRCLHAATQAEVCMQRGNRLQPQLG